jgi:hypothetical protein
VIDIISQVYSIPQTGDISIQQSTKSWPNDFENELSVHNQTDKVLYLSKVQFSEPDRVDQYTCDAVHNLLNRVICLDAGVLDKLLIFLAFSMRKIRDVSFVEFYDSFSFREFSVQHFCFR